MHTLVVPVADTATVTMAQAHPPAPRPTVLDRLAMRVALALLKWSLRPAPDPVAAHHRMLTERARVERERSWTQRALRQTIL